MKKVVTIILLTVVAFSFNSFTANAQEENDYFVGEWNVLTEGTPSGDAESTLILKRNDKGKLVGTFQKEGSGPTTLTRVEEKGDSITCYFVTSGYDVYLYLEKIDENEMEGTMMDMFDSYATRKTE